MEIGELVGFGPGGALGPGGSSAGGASSAALANPRWEHVDPEKKQRRPSWAAIGDEVWLVADAQKGLADGDQVVFLLYDEDDRFGAASGEIEGGSARARWVVRTRKPGSVTTRGRNHKYPRDASKEQERLDRSKVTFEATARGARTGRVRIPLRYPTMDVAVPVVFPDYRIATPIGRLPWLGHAGLLFINGHSGRALYYEYGRYDEALLGVVRPRAIPNVAPGPGGRPTRASLAVTLAAVSRKGGHGGRIEGAYIEEEGIFDKILAYVTRRYRASTDPARTPYNLRSNNCMTFARDGVAEAGLDVPWAFDPRPVSYVGELQGYYPSLRYDPATGQVTIDDVYEPAQGAPAEAHGP